MSKDNFETKKLSDDELNTVNGGLLRHAKYWSGTGDKVESGFEVVNSATGESYGIVKDWHDACKVASEHGLSCYGDWGGQHFIDIAKRQDAKASQK